MVKGEQDRDSEADGGLLTPLDCLSLSPTSNAAGRGG
jgi:hypothetical protein